MFLFLLCACSSDEALKPDDGLEREATVTLMVSPNGLGDNGYNDDAADGIFAFAQRSGVHLRLLQPQSDAEAQVMYSQWLADNAERDSAVLILASSGYDRIVSEIAQPDNFSEGGGRRILLFESDAKIEGVSTVTINRYGVSWLAGAMSQGFDAMILAAAEGFAEVEEAIAGFQAAREVYADEYLGFTCTTTLHYLAEDETGFAMPDSAYRYIECSVEAGSSYDEIIYPLLGGSIGGVIRYLNDDEFALQLMVGMDVDMTGRSSRIPFSVVINIGDVVGQYLDDWRDGRGWPQHQRLGMKDGACDIVITPNFVHNLNIYDERYDDPDAFRTLYEKYKEEALRKEEEHER